MSVRKRINVRNQQPAFNSRNRSPYKERPQHVVSALNYTINKRYPPRPIPKQPGLSELHKREKGNRLHTSPPQFYSCDDKITLAKIVQHAHPGEFIYYNSGSIDEIVYQVVNNNGTKKTRIIRDLMHGIENPVLDFPYRIYNRSRSRSRSRSPLRPTIGGRRRSTRKMKRRH
jgi:hypothetical protein